MHWGIIHDKKRQFKNKKMTNIYKKINFCLFFVIFSYLCTCIYIFFRSSSNNFNMIIVKTGFQSFFIKAAFLCNKTLCSIYVVTYMQSPMHFSVFSKKILYFSFYKDIIRVEKILRGRVKFPTGGKVREPKKADPV